MESPFNVTLAHHRTAKAVRLNGWSDPRAALRALGLEPGRPDGTLERELASRR
jgi:hypothetical protein